MSQGTATSGTGQRCTMAHVLRTWAGRRAARAASPVARASRPRTAETTPFVMAPPACGSHRELNEALPTLYPSHSLRQHRQVFTAQFTDWHLRLWRDRKNSASSRASRRHGFCQSSQSGRTETFGNSVSDFRTRPVGGVQAKRFLVAWKFFWGGGGFLPGQPLEIFGQICGALAVRPDAISAALLSVMIHPNTSTRSNYG